MLDLMYDLPSSKKTGRIKITKRMVEENELGLRPPQTVRRSLTMDPVNDPFEVLRTIPLIPLRDLVVFPSTLVPFIIGRAFVDPGPGKGRRKRKD